MATGQEIYETLQQHIDAYNENHLLLRKQLHSMAEENHREHGTIFSRLGTVETKQAHANGVKEGKKYAHSRGENGAMKVEHARKTDLWGYPVEKWVLITLAALAGDRLIHWAWMFIDRLPK